MSKRKENIKKFVEHYSMYKNGVQAYLHAFPNAKYNSAKVEASKLLTNPNVQEMIKDEQEKFAIKFLHSKEKTIQELLQAADEARAQGQYNAYAKIRDMVIKLLGIAPKQELDITSNGEKINITLNLGEDDDE